MRVAFAFLTRLPMATALDDRSLSGAAPWFPVVGLFVGAVMGGVHALAGLALEPPAATLVAVLAAVLITGGLHEDGLADVADAAGAHVSRERKLEILRDSRVGTFGALAVVFAIAFPLVVLAPLDGRRFLEAAIAAHVLGRWSSLPVSRLRPARPDGSGALLRATKAQLLAGTIVALAIVVAALGPEDAAATAGGASVTVTLAAGMALRVFGGVSGDVYGAVNKVVELTTYAVVAGSAG
jgi:adenosylcobinamide-GDP ribazoletransferase